MDSLPTSSADPRLPGNWARLRCGHYTGEHAPVSVTVGLSASTRTKLVQASLLRHKPSSSSGLPTKQGGVIHLKVRSWATVHQPRQGAAGAQSVQASSTAYGRGRRSAPDLINGLLASTLSISCSSFSASPFA